MLPLAFGVLLAGLSCPRGFDVVDDACVVMPPKPTALVVYFHGMLPAATDWTRVRELSLMGAEARRRGVALLAPRGEQGLCAWSKDVARHWCWPSDRSQLAEVSRLLERLKLTRLAVKPVLAGFSNGAYFVTLLATDTQLDAAAYVVLHAGPVTGSIFTPARARPALLLGAAQDAYQLPGMKRLQSMLEEAKWSSLLKVREGVHEVTQADVAALFDFVASLPDTPRPSPGSTPP